MTVPVPRIIHAYTVNGVILEARLGTPDMWERPDVRRALALHDFTSLFKILRAHGISQRKLAAVLDCGQSEISEIMNGRQVISYPVLVRWAEGLQVPRSWLGLAHDTDTEAIMRESLPEQ